jgi:hypothetical protein
MQIYGRSSVREFLGDNIVYRNLEPVDDQLPNLGQLRATLGLPAGRVPRKSELDYARVIVQILQAARKLTEPNQPLERLIFVGDTHLNDGTAFTNICNAGSWSGLAFIGSEKGSEPESELVPTVSGQHILVANRWESLYDFDQLCADRSLPVDQNAVVIIDLDKTALGARGRNDHVINQARIQAVRDTVAEFLGAEFDEEDFTAVYDRFNGVEFHPFTTDNQDYLAYLCLIVGGGLFDANALSDDILDERLTSFRAFIDSVNERSDDLPAGLAAVHRDIYNTVLVGDPTPFKAFRRQEFLTTINRMGCVPDPAMVERLFSDEIVITQEVRALALEWKARGALLFGLSDKPDEASLPTTELAAQGFFPIHRTETHVVGQPRQGKGAV